MPAPVTLSRRACLWTIFYTSPDETCARTLDERKRLPLCLLGGAVHEPSAVRWPCNCDLLTVDQCPGLGDNKLLSRWSKVGPGRPGAIRKFDLRRREYE